MDQSNLNDTNKELKKRDRKIPIKICLPDTLLNRYMNLITKLSPSTLYAFNTHFFTVFSDHGYSRIHRWTKKIDIFSKERLLIPIHFKSSNMWGLINVNFGDKSIRYYDNLGNSGIKYQNLILKYLKLEYLMRKGKFFQSTGWRLTNLSSLNDGFKCWDSGIFLCLAAQHFAQNISGDASLSFSSDSVGGERVVRKKIAIQIKRNSISK